MHIIAVLIATYAEKGYYLRVKGLLLIGKKVTTYTQANVTLTLNKKMMEKSGVTITEQGSNIIFTLPVGDYVGSSVVDVFTEK